MGHERSGLYNSPEARRRVGQTIRPARARHLTARSSTTRKAAEGESQPILWSKSHCQRSVSKPSGSRDSDKDRRDSYSVKSFGNLEKALIRFVFHVQDVLNEAVRDKLERASFQRRWFPSPSLIRMQSDPPERQVSVLRRVQQPLIMLLLGTIVGSTLISLDPVAFKYEKSAS